jgi:hypothetical protein
MKLRDYTFDFFILSFVSILFYEPFDIQVMLETGYNIIVLKTDFYTLIGNHTHFKYLPLTFIPILSGQIIFYRILGYEHYNENYLLAIYTLKLPFILLQIVTSRLISDKIVQTSLTTLGDYQMMKLQTILYRILVYFPYSIYSMTLSTQLDLIMSYLFLYGITKIIFNSNTLVEKSAKGYLHYVVAGISLGFAFQIKFYVIPVAVFGIYLLFKSNIIKFDFICVLSTILGILVTIIFLVASMFFVGFTDSLNQGILFHLNRGPSGFSIFGLIFIGILFINPNITYTASTLLSWASTFFLFFILIIFFLRYYSKPIETNEFWRTLFKFSMSLSPL